MKGKRRKGGWFSLLLLLILLLFATERGASLLGFSLHGIEGGEKPSAPRGEPASPGSATPPTPPFPGRGELEVHFIDVNQGDSILILTPRKKKILIDGGEFLKKNPLVPYLKRHNIDTLDMVMGSHPHEDHIGGFLHLFRLHPPRLYSDPGFPHSTVVYIKLLDMIEDGRIRYIQAKRGQKYILEKDILLEILLPDVEFLENTRSDANNNSIIARLSYGKIDFLFTGDAEFEEEKRLLHLGDEIESEILKVPHHGSTFSSSEPFIRRVNPEIGIVMCGKLNPYDHPHEETLERYRESGVRLYRTDLHGDIVVRTRGEDFRVKTEH